MSNINQIIAVPLLDALGINGDDITKLTLVFEGGQLPMVEVQKVVPEGFGEQAALVLSQFHLVPTDQQQECVGFVDKSVSLKTGALSTHRLPDSQARPAGLSSELSPSTGPSLNLEK